MIIVFEGCRNSGKTFLSEKVSEALSMPRYKFDFVGYFSAIGLDSKSQSAHSFAIGKELMLMQINRDGLIQDDVIVDRGFLTVLAWGICEKRISKDDAIFQLRLMINKSLLKNVTLIYVNKNSNVSSKRGPKDQWDRVEESTEEMEAYKFLLDYLISDVNVPGFSLLKIDNDFNEDSINNTIKCIKDVRDSNK